MIDRRVPNWAAVGVGVVGIGIGVGIGWGVFSSAKATPLPSQQDSSASPNVSQGVLENCARSAIGEIQMALFLWYRYVAQPNAYPESLDRISRMLASGQTPVDPWGRAYAYSPSADQQTYALVSAGSDGKFGTPDDLRADFSRFKLEAKTSRDARSRSAEAPSSPPKASFKIRGQKTVGGICKVFLEIVQAEPGLTYVEVFAIAENKSVLDSTQGYLPKGYGPGALVDVAFFSTPCSRISSLQFEPK